MRTVCAFVFIMKLFTVRSPVFKNQATGSMNIDVALFSLTTQQIWQ